MTDLTRTTLATGGFRRYVMVLRRPGVGRPAAGAAVGSLPIGMLGLALLLLVRQRSPSGFADAGLVVGLFGVGTGVGMTIQGRLIDRFGPARVLLAAAAVQAAALVGLVQVTRVDGPTGLVALGALLAGAGEPQIGGSLRGLWPDLVPDELRGTAVALSSVLFEAPVLLGPLVLVGVLAVAGPGAAVLVAGAFFAVGAWMLARSTAARAWEPSPRRARERLVAFRSRGVQTVMDVAAAHGMITGLVQVSAAAATVRSGLPGRTPLLYAALSAGSLLGAVGYGALRRSGPAGRALSGLLVAVAVASSGCAAVAASLGWLAVGLFTGGLLLGPAAVCYLGQVDVLAPAGARVEAFTTVTAAGLAGFAGGTAAAGVIVDRTGPGGGFLTAAVIAAAPPARFTSAGRLSAEAAARPTAPKDEPWKRSRPRRTPQGRVH